MHKVSSPVFIYIIIIISNIHKNVYFMLFSNEILKLLHIHYIHCFTTVNIHLHIFYFLHYKSNWLTFELYTCNIKLFQIDVCIYIYIYCYFYCDLYLPLKYIMLQVINYNADNLDRSP